MSKRFIFTISNICEKEIINLHFNNANTVIESTEKETPQTTDYSIPECDFFIDAKKVKVTIIPTMVDLSSGSVALPLFTNKPCRNCHHSYKTHPFGCPMSILSLKDCIFGTEYMFCTLSCIKAYILMKISQGSQKHHNSLSYLSLMAQCTLKECENSIDLSKIFIPTATSIDLIDTYGGNFTIEEYRKNTSSPLCTVNVKRPIMISTTYYYEKTQI